ncbi:MAG: hypothetical protein ACLRFM_02490 [Alphaproteobacteria bacterium]
MATKYKLFGVLQNGDKRALFNGATFSQKQNAIKRLAAAANKNKLSEFTKILFQEIKFFERGPNVAKWPDGQTTDITFDVMDGKIPLEKIKSVLIKPRVVVKKSEKFVRYSYIEKYAIAHRSSVKYLPKNVDVVDFIKRLQNLNFKYLNCVLLMREVFDTDTNDAIFYEQMLYNPAYLTHDTMGVVMGSLRDTHTTIRYINKRDLPITKTILNHWLDDFNKINPKLVKFLKQNER